MKQNYKGDKNKSNKLMINHLPKRAEMMNFGNQRLLRAGAVQLAAC